MHPNHLKRTISRTQRQIKKQKAKLYYAKELPDKISAKDELNRLRKKLVMLQELSNKPP